MVLLHPTVRHIHWWRPLELWWPKICMTLRIKWSPCHCHWLLLLKQKKSHFPHFLPLLKPFIRHISQSPSAYQLKLRRHGCVDDVGRCTTGQIFVCCWVSSEIIKKKISEAAFEWLLCLFQKNVTKWWLVHIRLRSCLSSWDIKSLIKSQWCTEMVTNYICRKARICLDQQLGGQTQNGIFISNIILEWLTGPIWPSHGPDWADQWARFGLRASSWWPLL